MSTTIKITNKEWKEINKAFESLRYAEKELEMWKDRESRNAIRHILTDINFPETISRFTEKKKAALDTFNDTADKVHTWLEDAQKRCRERTISPYIIFGCLESYEKKLGIKHKAMDGIEISKYDFNAQQFPNAYKYRPESTHFDAVYKNGIGWIITKIYRDTCDKNNGEVTLTDEARAEVLANAVKL